MFRLLGLREYSSDSTLKAMTVLAQSISQEILKHGSISFARFMELSLYTPKLGYYEGITDRIGRKGDYFTSSTVGEVFGELLCWQFIQWLLKLDNERFQVVEGGAHNGRLAGDILHSLRTLNPKVYSRTEYWIVEPSAERRQWQRRQLAAFWDKVTWFPSWNEPCKKGVHGVIFCNELLDALPVHRLGWDSAGQRWFEWRVGLEGDRLVWQRPAQPDPNPDHLKPDLPEALLEILPDGFSTEICPEARLWWQQAARSLRQGRLVALDYGLNNEEFFVPARSAGTLRAYFQHHLSKDLLARPGEQDITSHVNFTSILAEGEHAGLRTEDLVSQSTFLTRVLRSATDHSRDAFKWDANRVRQFQTLTHPDHLGHSFRVLIQSRC